MQDHRYSFEIDATPEELRRLFLGHKEGDAILRPLRERTGSVEEAA